MPRVVSSLVNSVQDNEPELIESAEPEGRERLFQ
jgi:hypothetical protein